MISKRLISLFFCLVICVSVALHVQGMQAASSKYFLGDDSNPRISFVTDKPVGVEIKIVLYSESEFSIDWGDGVLKQYEPIGFNELQEPIRGSTVKVYGRDILGFTSVLSGITSIDLSNCPMLSYLALSGNKLSKLDVSKNPELSSLTCALNLLTDLDLTANQKLSTLKCYENRIRNIDVSNQPYLSTLIVDDNLLTSLDVSANPELSELQASGNKLKSLDLTKNVMLRHLILNNVGINKLDVRPLVRMEAMLINGNQLSSIDLTQMENLRKISVINNCLTDLDVSHNPNLFSIECDSNRISILDVSRCTKLMRLNCTDNRITSINPEPSKAQISEIKLSGNPLSEIPVFHNYPRLQILHIARCGAKAVDLGETPKLINIDVSGNNLEAPRLNELFNALPDLTGKKPEVPILANIFGKCSIYNNPGMSAADLSIARAKSWDLLSLDPTGIYRVRAVDTDFFCRYDRVEEKLIFSDPAVVDAFQIYDLNGRQIVRGNAQEPRVSLSAGIDIVHIFLKDGRCIAAKIEIPGIR